jgi:PAS domain-containing protein
VNREECSVRIHLADEYSRLVTEFNTLLDALKAPSRKSKQDVLTAAEMAKASSQKAWDALEKHIHEHRCIDLQWAPVNPPNVSGSAHILALAAMAAVDVILVANDDRQFVDVNAAATALLRMPRSKIIGRRIDEFFRESSGEPIPEAWAGFLADGALDGICELTAPGKRRRFAYRAKANFAPGLHLSVLRELDDDPH